MDRTKSSPPSAPKPPAYVSQDQLRRVAPTPPRPAAKELVSLMVTADSVVATALIVVDDSHRKIWVRWGDGTTDVIDLHALRPLSVQGIADNQSPNTLRVQHAYRSPFDTGSRLITVVSVDDQGESATESAVVDLERRFRVNLFSVVLEFPHHLDSVFETKSEIQASMHATFEGDKFFSQTWKSDVVTAPSIVTGQPITWLLEGSGFQRELRSTDEPIKIWFDVAENDGPGDEGSLLNTIWDVVTSPVILFKMYPLSTNPGLDEFDVPNQISSLPFTLHPDTSLGTTVATGVYRLSLDRGVVFVRFHYELQLIVPLDPDGKNLMTTT